jgi:hypothetical protein
MGNWSLMKRKFAGCCLVRAERPTSDPTENQIACSRAETTRATQDQNWEPESVGGGGKIDPVCGPVESKAGQNNHLPRWNT